jgi:hypothetical protein
MDIFIVKRCVFIVSPKSSLRRLANYTSYNRRGGKDAPIKCGNKILAIRRNSVGLYYTLKPKDIA